MAQQSVAVLRKRAERAMQQTIANRSLYDDVYDYFMPYHHKNSSGDSLPRPYVQYDSTPQRAMSAFVATLMANITPPDSRWAVLRAGAFVENDSERKKLNKELDPINNKIYAYLNASNFYTCLQDAYTQLSMGHCCLWLLEGDADKPFKFMSTPIYNLGISSGAEGDIEFIVREHMCKPSEVQLMYPDATITDSLRQRMNEATEAEEEDIELCEVQYLDAENKVWRFEVIFEEDRLLERESATRICLTPRWEVVSGYDIGVGVALQALPDVRTLNKSKQLHLESAAINVFGVHTIRNDAIVNPNALIIEPGVFIPIGSGGGQGSAIEPLATGGSYTASKDMVEQDREQVRAMMLDNRLPEQQAQPATALEIAERVAQYTEDFGSVYARLRTEFIIPLFRRMLDILARKGLITLPQGLEIDELLVMVQVLSPIGQLQNKRDLQKIMEAFSMSASIAPTETMLAYDMGKIPQVIAEKVGASTELMNDKTAEEISTEAEAIKALQLAQGENVTANGDNGGTG